MFSITCRSAANYYSLKEQSKTSKTKLQELEKPVLFPIPPEIPPSSLDHQVTLFPTDGPKARAVSHFSRAILHSDSVLDSEFLLSEDEISSEDDEPYLDRSNQILEEFFGNFFAKLNFRLEYDRIKNSITTLEKHLPLEQDIILKEFMLQIKGIMQINKTVDDSFLEEILISMKAFVAHHPDELLEPFNIFVKKHIPSTLHQWKEDNKQKVQVLIEANFAFQQKTLTVIKEYLA